MTAPTLTEGDRFLDNCGRTWTVDEHGGLTHEAPAGILRRSWHSLDACAGPLQPVHDKPQPGDKYRDGDGDTWTVLADGRLAWDETANAAHPLTETFSDFAAEYGPITKVETDEDEPKLRKMVNDPFRPLPLFTDAQRDAIGAAVDRVFPPLDDDDPVNHPQHYTSHPSGVECITVTEHMNFCIGNAVKYLWRAGLKNDAIEDLRKAEFYVRREIERRENEARQQLDAA